MERYEVIKDIGSGNFGVAKLVRDVRTKELFAIKFIERGHKIDENVQREIINHRSLRHPNIVRFKELLACTSSSKKVVSICNPSINLNRTNGICKEKLYPSCRV